MKPAKTMTIRLSPEQAEALETVAAVDEQALAEVIRAAIDGHVRSRTTDRHFQESLAIRIERAKKFLKPDSL